MHSFIQFIDEGWLSRLFGRKPKEKVPQEPAKWTTAMSAKVKEPFTVPSISSPKIHSIEHFLDWHEKRDPNFGKRVVKTIRMMRKDAAEGIRMMGEFTKEYQDKFGFHPGDEDTRVHALMDKWHALIDKHGDAKAKKATAEMKRKK